MYLLVSGATRTLRRYAQSPYLGALLVPGAGNRPDAWPIGNRVWAADNAAFHGFDPGPFCGLLARIADQPGCRFVACPDVVGDASATLALFDIWQPILQQLRLPVALVAQDGAEEMDLSWDRFQVLFLGGTTDWKLGSAATRLAREAKRRGLWLHLGRCNTKKRFRHAFAVGCDSIDGSGFSRWPDQTIPLALGWLAELHGESCAPSHPSVRRFFRHSGAEGLGLVGQSGWVVDHVRFDQGVFVLESRYTREPFGCPQCGRSFLDQEELYRHGWREQLVRDRPRHGHPVRIQVRRRRYRCGGCASVFTPDLPGVRNGWSEALRDYAQRECRHRSQKEVTRAIGMDVKTLRWMLREDPIGKA
jgi:hypothetical protein